MKSQKTKKILGITAAAVIVITLLLMVLFTNSFKAGESLRTESDTGESGSGAASDSINLTKLEPEIVLATTTSTQDTGLLDVLVPAFEEKYNVKVKTIAAGTGEAINMGKRGDADVLLVHSRTQEDDFVAEDYGVNRRDVMYNFFYIVGPHNDPAEVEKATTAADAFLGIAESEAFFVSRGDNSGTHSKEKSVWTKSGVTPNAKNDSWYIEAGQGMGATLTMANEMGAYTLVDSGTWHAFENKVDMKIVKENDSISIIHMELLQ